MLLHAIRSEPSIHSFTCDGRTLQICMHMRGSILPDCVDLIGVSLAWSRRALYFKFDNCLWLGPKWNDHQFQSLWSTNIFPVFAVCFLKEFCSQMLCICSMVYQRLCDYRNCRSMVRAKNHLSYGCVLYMCDGFSKLTFPPTKLMRLPSNFLWLIAPNRCNDLF